MRLPEKGKTREEIFRFLGAAKAHDVPWEDGRLFGYVYDPGEEVREVGKQAFMAYLTENALDPSVFPSLLKLETDVVRAVIDLLRGGRDVVGNITSGGTESIVLAVKTARDWARVHRPEIREPEIVLCQTAHHAFHKAAHLLGLKVVVTPSDPITYRADVTAMRAGVTPNTVLLVASAPCYSHGVVDSVPEIAELAQSVGALCHVDACVGGIYMAFLRKMGRQVPLYDWSVPGVTSISTDLHKFGYCPKPAAVIMYRSKDLRQYQIYATTTSTCYPLVNPTLLSSKSGGPLAAAWAVLNFPWRGGVFAPG